MTGPEATAHQPESGLADFDARRAVSEQLDDTLFVEASAGTGKTASLVARVVNLVAGGKATLDHIAAITFTEAAAAELRDRIRQQLELAGDDESRDSQERRRCLRGVADLDQAAICTLHAFAALILHERPLEGRPASCFRDQRRDRLPHQVQRGVGCLARSFSRAGFPSGRSHDHCPVPRADSPQSQGSRPEVSPELYRSRGGSLHAPGPHDRWRREYDRGRPA